MQNRNRNTYVENKGMDTRAGKLRGEELEDWDWRIFVQLLDSVLCADLNGKGVQKRGDTCIHVIKLLLDFLLFIFLMSV